MSDQHIITDNELDAFGASNDYKSRIKAFIRQQKAEWETAHKNYKALSTVELKTITFENATIQIQQNPDRIRSSAARTDKKSINERPCFLCSDKLIPGQKILPYNDRYQILCNPYPIFQEHLTITSLTHQPQRIVDNFMDMLTISRNLCDFTVFYNGPKCGASAPDHMHFQAGTYGFMPIDSELDKLSDETKTLLLEELDTIVFASDDGLRKFLVLESNNPEKLNEIFSLIYDVLSEISQEKEEPKMNILSHYDKRWRIMVFPRDRQHPDCFFAEEDKRIIIGPASVELGGIAILPRAEDYKKISKKDLVEIFHQVSIGQSEFEILKSRIKNSKQPTLDVGIMAKTSVSFQFKGSYSSGSIKCDDACNYKAVIELEKIAIYCEEKSIASGIEFTFTPEQDTICSFLLKDVMIGIGFHWQQNQDQQFTGGLKLIIENENIRVINLVPLEEYLRSVISSEMSANSSPELLKAHAVISRSWLLAQIEKKQLLKNKISPGVAYSETDDEIIRWYDREDHEGFDVCADDHCQRYQGISKIISQQANDAIDRTFGLGLTHEGKICDARFSKCCGGITESFENVWEPEKHLYLQSIVDHSITSGRNDLRIEPQATKWIKSYPPAFCNSSDSSVLSQILPDFDQPTKDFYRWKISYTQKQLASLIQKKSGLDLGCIIRLEPIERGYSGRIIRLRIRGSTKSVIIGKELEIRKTLSETHLYSSAFVVDHLEIQNDVPQKFEIYGAGWGHGVGLCQIGAAMMAEQGYSFDEILKHYFSSSKLTKLYNEKN